MSKPEHFKFRLYVAGNGPNSVQAVDNLQALCREHLAERHEIEVVDVLREPERALVDLVMLTPLLVKLCPPPISKITGTLSSTEPVLSALGLPT